MNKIKLALISSGLAVTGAVLSLMSVAHAAVTSTPITVPTDLANAAMAFAGSQLSDPGLEVLLLVVIGVPFAFYIIHKVIGLVPKGR